MEEIDPVDIKAPPGKSLHPISALNLLPLNQVLMDNISKMKIQNLTPVQTYTIPAILGGDNIMCCSATGSGKSFAFLIPMLNRFLEKDMEANAPWTEPALPKVLILTPTRELAEQIAKEAKSYCKGSWLPTHIHSVVGGHDMRSENVRFKRRPVSIVVATIGRLLGRKESGDIDFSGVEYLVIDEAAEMFRKGFVKDVLSIATECSKDVQTMMFSADYPNEVIKAGEILLKEHFRIIVGCIGAANEDIDQELCLVESGDKNHELRKLIMNMQYKKIVVFCATKEIATNVFGFATDTCSTTVTYIHSDLSQDERENALYGLTTGQFRVMIATSVMARGLDVPNVDLVVNYDLPEDSEEYILRIGRTGRIGHEGCAISFFHPILDGQKAGRLISILRSSKQGIPMWLEKISENEAQMEEADQDIFGTFDYGDRRRNGIGSAPRGVPLPIEVQDTEW